MKEYIPVKENLNLLRDPNTNAVLNTNKGEYETYIRMKSQKEKELDKVSQIENELSEMKNDLNEIKNLLRSLSNESK